MEEEPGAQVGSKITEKKAGGRIHRGTQASTARRGKREEEKRIGSCGGADHFFRRGQNTNNERKAPRTEGKKGRRNEKRLERKGKRGNNTGRWAVMEDRGVPGINGHEGKGPTPRGRRGEKHKENAACFKFLGGLL